MSLISRSLLSMSGSVYCAFVSALVVPFIVKFLKPIVDGSSEQLRVEITSIRRKLRFGGQRKLTQNNNETDEVSLFIHNPIHFCWLLILDQKIGLGESYMNGDWEAVPGLKEFLTCLIRAKKEKSSLLSSSPRVPHAPSPVQRVVSWVGGFLLSALRSSASLYNYLLHRFRDNTIFNSRQNISEHYDLGNEMFELFLDPSMTYSCALFQDPNKEVSSPVDMNYLEEAQYRKVDSLLDSLSLTERDHVLEIGCGWGATAIRAVQRFNCKWTGLTISTEQLELAQQKVREAGMEDRIELKLLDYRLETGTYSAVISIEMIEAVGAQFLPQYFQVIQDRLDDGGRAALQAIVYPDVYYAQYCRSSDFIKKHIFPGGHLPSLGAIQSSLPRCMKTGEPEMKMTIEREMAKHYSHTLDHWMSSWMARQSHILGLGYSEIFHRKWQFYFGLCSALFAHEHINVIQFTLQKPLVHGN